MIADPALGERLAGHRLRRVRVSRLSRRSWLNRYRTVSPPCLRPPSCRSCPVARRAKRAARGGYCRGDRADDRLGHRRWSRTSVGYLASGALGDALDRQLGADGGEPRLVVSFRNRRAAIAGSFSGAREMASRAASRKVGGSFDLTPGGEVPRLPIVRRDHPAPQHWLRHRR